MTNAFSGNLNTVNLHLNIKHRPFQEIMKVFIPKVNISENSKIVPCSVSVMLTLTWGIDILFEKLTPETGGSSCKIPFALCIWGRGFHVKPELPWGQVNSLRVGEKYVCCLFIVVVFMGLGRAKR